MGLVRAGKTAGGHERRWENTGTCLLKIVLILTCSTVIEGLFSGSYLNLEKGKTML